VRYDALLEDYKLKLDYLTTQYNRMWARFNFLLGTELAVFGFLGYVTFDAKLPEATRLPIVAGLAISALWYVVGAQDRALVDEYRRRATSAARALSDHPEGIPGYEATHPAAPVRNRRGFFSWYWRPISITRLPAIIGFLLFATWFWLLFSWRGIAEDIVKHAEAKTYAARQRECNVR
jgi:hypothetical protein